MKGWRTVNFGQLIELWALSSSTLSGRGGVVRGRGNWEAKADRRISFWHMCWRGAGMSCGGDRGYNYMTHVWGRLPARVRWVRNIFCTQVSQQKQFELSESFCVWVSEMHIERGRERGREKDRETVAECVVVTVHNPLRCAWKTLKLI